VVSGRRIPCSVVFPIPVYGTRPSESPICVYKVRRVRKSGAVCNVETRTWRRWKFGTLADGARTPESTCSICCKGNMKSRVLFWQPCCKKQVQSHKQRYRYMLCDAVYYICIRGCGYQHFFNCEHESSLFLRKGIKGNLTLLLNNTPWMNAEVVGKRFRVLLKFDILLKFWPV
jgi:hypothetical protein